MRSASAGLGDGLMVCHSRNTVAKIPNTAVKWRKAKKALAAMTDRFLENRFAAGSGLDRRFEQAAELTREVDRHAGVHRPLLVEEALPPGQAEHAFMPDVRMDVEPLAAVEAEADEAL